MKYYKAINYWVLGGFEGEKSPYQAIDDAAGFGLDGIELTFGDCIKEDITSDECGKIKSYAEQKNIGLKTMAAGFYWGCSLGSDDPEERSKAVDFTFKYIQVASWLGVNKILVVPGAVDVAWDDSRPVTSYADVWKYSIDSLKQVLDAAENSNVTICLENVWNKFLLSPIEFSFYLDQFDSDFIGVYFDVGNSMLNGYAEHWIEILKDNIKAVHFKNFKRDDCGGTLHGFGENILEGDVNYSAIFRELKKIKYSGPITAEMIPFSRLPDLVLPDMKLAADTAKSLITLLNG
ncbi:MAG: sugar phosphate isomerase/epimerase [Spirochaetes bacterium]|nr:MAG: sugar phosphate isomerase/epimerase [Spirochaetota bacterium]